MAFLLRGLLSGLVFIMDPSRPGIQLFFLKIIMGTYVIFMSMHWPWRLWALNVVDLTVRFIFFRD